MGHQFLQATGYKYECIIEVSESQNALESPISEFIKSEDCVQSGMVEKSQVYIMNQDPYQLHVESYINFIEEKNLERDRPPSGKHIRRHYQLIQVKFVHIRCTLYILFNKSKL